MWMELCLCLRGFYVVARNIITMYIPSCCHHFDTVHIYYEASIEGAWSDIPENHILPARASCKEERCDQSPREVPVPHTSTIDPTRSKQSSSLASEDILDGIRR